MTAQPMARRVESYFGLPSVGALVVALWAPWALAQSPKDYEGNCTDAACHGKYTRLPVVHSPVEDGSCDACHEQRPGEIHKFQLTGESPDLCYECHDEYEGKVIHDPIAGGECLTCHDPHGGSAKRLLTSDTVGELCAECHEEITEDLAYLHGPAAAGECTTCHQPHESNEAKLLVASGRALCTECHTTIADRIKGAKFNHAPVEDGCTDCHNPHGADNKLMLASAVPDMCVDCHDEIGELMEDATLSHSPVSTGKSCSTCHDPHASGWKGMLQKAPMELCLTCHNQEIAIERGKVANIGEGLKKHANHHGPIQDGECQPCHDPHGGKRAALLTAAYPPKFYAPYSEDEYALCFECHEVEAFEDEQTEDATGFRNGKRNLHYLHVNRKVKGRTCRACHSPHYTSHPKQIAEGVTFGKWRIPLNFSPTASGGSCQPGCHRRYRYDREQPIVNLE